VRRVFRSKLREYRAVNILLGLAIAEGRLSTLSVIAAITVISSIAAVPVMFTGFGRLRRLRIFGQRDKLKADRSKGA
jgi:Flp pilus assembly protein TadB